MRRLLVNSLALALGACGAIAPPVPGRYAVTLTLDGSLCAGSTSTGDPFSQTWIIAQETSGYTVSLQDAHGDTMVYATSKDGHRFTGTANASDGSCYFWLSWVVEVSYGDNEITGTNINTISIPASCASEPPCSETWKLQGTKQ